MSCTSPFSTLLSTSPQRSSTESNVRKQSNLVLCGQQDDAKQQDRQNLPQLKTNDIDIQQPLHILSNGEPVLKTTKADLRDSPTCLNQRDTLKSLNAKLLETCNTISNDYATGKPLTAVITSLITTLRENLYLLGFYLRSLWYVVQSPDFVKEDDKIIYIEPKIGQGQQLQSLHAFLLKFLFKVLAEHLLAQDLSTKYSKPLDNSEDLKFVQEVLYTYVINYHRLEREKSTEQCPDLWIQVNEYFAVLQLAIARRSLALTTENDSIIPSHEDREQTEYALEQIEEAERVARSQVCWLRKRPGCTIKDDGDTFAHNIFSPLYEVLSDATKGYLLGRKDQSYYKEALEPMMDHSLPRPAPIFKGFRTHDPTTQYFYDTLLREESHEYKRNWYSRSKRYQAKLEFASFKINRMQWWIMRLVTLY